MASDNTDGPQVQLRKAKPVLIGAGVILILMIVALTLSSEEGEEPVNGVLTHVDLSKRLAAAEILDPRTNFRRELLGEVPADCVITINGAPASLSDLRVGDKVAVTASVMEEKLPSGAIAIAQTIEVTR